jgi:Nif-specific regulatory protein
MKPQNPFEALVEISEKINTLHKTDTLLDTVMDIAMETLDAERGFILLKSDEKSKDFKEVCARNISKTTITSIRELSSSVVNQVLNTGKPVLTMDAQSDQRFSGAESVMFHNIRSVICTPFILGNQLIGAIYMDSRSGEGKFDEDSMKFLQAFSKQAVIAIENARLFETLESENKHLKKQISLSDNFPEIIGSSPAIIKIFEIIRDVAGTTASVLIEGESGTGKELVARAIHTNSDRRSKPFIPIFCGSLAENILESELFGHKKGAFTGAVENKAGLFEEASGGTLFLDEIAEINKNIQTKLLRVLQEGEIKRVGEVQIRKVEVRILSATNKDLLDEIKKGNFREDLYYRLNVINIKMPPLRERKEDIPLLAEHFLRRFAERNKKNVEGFSTEALEYLMTYHWAGNIRELENTIERAVILSKGKLIEPENLSMTEEQPQIAIGQTLEEIEKSVVLSTLNKNDNNRTKTAEVLGVSRRWLQYRLKDWGIGS